MLRFDLSNPDEIHSDQCTGTEEDLRQLKITLLLDEPTSEMLQDATLHAARLGHRKCLRVLLQHVEMKIPNHVLMTIVFLTTRSESRQTMNFGLSLLDSLTALQRRNTITELLDVMVINNNSHHLEHLLRRLGAACRTQTLNALRVGQSRPVFRQNVPMKAVIWRRPECLRLVLRHGAVVDSFQFHAIHNRLLSDERQHEQVSLVLAWASSISADVNKEKEILQLLFQFGANMWEKNADGCQALHILTAFPLNQAVCQFAPPEGRVPIVTYLKEMMSSPRSLKSACRLVITRKMGLASEANVKRLGNIPTTLYKYLRFEELKCKAPVLHFDGDSEVDSDEEAFDDYLALLKETEKMAKRF